MVPVQAMFDPTEEKAWVWAVTRHRRIRRPSWAAVTREGTGFTLCWVWPAGA